MNIEPRKPSTPFDFGQAVGAMFNTSGGKAFAWRLLFWTTAFMSVVSLITIPFVLPYYGDLMAQNAATMQAIMSGQTPPQPNTDEIMQIYVRMLPISLVMLLGYWAAYASGEAALHRKFISDVEGARRPTRFGKDELRVMLAQLGVWGLFFAVYIGFIILIVAAAVIPVLGVIIAVVGIFVMLALFVWVPVRFAPAAALSLTNNQAHLMAARHVTKHRFWPLFGAYIVVFIGGYILITVVMMTAIMLVTGDPNFMMTMYGLGGEDPATAMAAAGERLKNPIFMLIGVLGIILYSAAYAFWLLTIAGVASYAVKWWHDDNPVAQFE